MSVVDAREPDEALVHPLAGSISKPFSRISEGFGDIPRDKPVLVVSLAVQTACPSCGAVGVNLNRQTGMCRKYSEEYHLTQERAFNEQLERERAAAEEAPEIDDVRRERDMMRQRNSRPCRKYGLKRKRERRGL